MRFPKDEDGQTLELLYKNGIDFNKKHLRETKSKMYLAFLRLSRDLRDNFFIVQ